MIFPYRKAGIERGWLNRVKKVKGRESQKKDKVN